METKKCYKCKKDLPLCEFKKHCKRKDGLQPDCILCQKEYRKLHYVKNKDKYMAKAKSTTLRNVVWFKEYKSKLKCEFCEESHPACLQFHHKDREDKEYAISLLVRSGCSIDKILNEIHKCQVVCANCHFKIHWEEKYGGGT